MIGRAPILNSLPALGEKLRSVLPGGTVESESP